MNSMTGHGRGEALAKNFRAVVECASVNRKQAEVGVVAPRELSTLEPLIRKDVLRCISRGKVSVTITLERGESGSSLNTKRAETVHRELKALQAKLGITGPVPLEAILSAPGVLATNGGTAEEAWPAIRRALAQALEALSSMRASEGKHLHADLSRALKRLEAGWKKIRALSPAVPVRQRENLLKRLRASGLDLSSEDPRLAAEIAIFADRCDISEEIARFDSHAAQFREKLAASEPVGRTLEFLIQEMARESNTVGAKANDAAISRIVVECKAELEKLREQLANIE